MDTDTKTGPACAVGRRGEEDGCDRKSREDPGELCGHQAPHFLRESVELDEVVPPDRGAAPHPAHRAGVPGHLRRAAREHLGGRADRGDQRRVSPLRDPDAGIRLDLDRGGDRHLPGAGAGPL